MVDKPKRPDPSQFARDMAAHYPRVMASLRASELAEKTETETETSE